jgi:enoyl-CoA hydratase/carnithine racemase
VPVEAAAFFENEYRLDYRIHTYPKPVLCWGHGIIMGGGVGLFAGASHRVVTPRTKFAMPEITIGLYPDVGGSWFLARMRGRTGLFLALTGAPLNTADLRYAGLADYTVNHESQKDVYDAIATTRWVGAPDVDHAQLSHLLDRLASQHDVQTSALRVHADLIDRTMGNDALADIALRLAALCDHADPWLATAGRSFAKGSPTSAMLCFQLQKRARHLSLAEAFRMEYLASVGCAMGHDFAEGIRALLVDKDRNPAWRPDRLDAVRPADIDSYLLPRFAGEHPLNDLD